MTVNPDDECGDTKKEENSKQKGIGLDQFKKTCTGKVQE